MIHSTTSHLSAFHENTNDMRPALGNPYLNYSIYKAMIILIIICSLFSWFVQVCTGLYRFVQVFDKCSNFVGILY